LIEKFVVLFNSLNEILRSADVESTSEAFERAAAKHGNTSMKKAVHSRTALGEKLPSQYVHNGLRFPKLPGVATGWLSGRIMVFVYYLVYPAPVPNGGCVREEHRIFGAKRGLCNAKGTLYTSESNRRVAVGRSELALPGMVINGTALGCSAGPSNHCSKEGQYDQ